ncbi:MAG TPA: hypothetical protein VIM53_04250 [Candidatus Saccharimonadales bacterium]
MFDGNNNAPQANMPQSDNNMMQSQAVGTPANPMPAPGTDTAGEYMLEDGTPATTTVEPTAPAAPAPTSDAASAPAMPTPATDPDELLELKQQALQQLSPLLGHLDQSPEEKFRTTMMLIQASDNDTLLKQAYEAAQAITDEKVRAQALLDVVNEINYFTQHAEAEEK